MGIPKPDYSHPIFKYWPEIERLEKEISACKWWQVIKAARLNGKLRDVRHEAMCYGVNLALRDLEECGIIKII